MTNSMYWRQLTILPPKKTSQTPITLVGAGGIGSPTALALAKMGITDLTVFDFDSVELHNLPNQFFRREDIGQSKVQALSDIIKSYTNVQINSIPQALEKQKLSGLVISGVDTMKSRAEIWKQVKMNLDVPLYIDGRMGGELIHIYTVRPCSDSAWYEKTLRSDEEVPDLACTAQAIIYNSLGCADLICSQVKKYITGEPLKREIVFDHETMTLVTMCDT